MARRRAELSPDDCAYVLLEDGETETRRVTYAELDAYARQIAAELQSRCARGERAILLYPPGIDYILAFFGCIYAGVVAVPAYPPDPNRLNRTLPRLQAIAADSQARLVLTTKELLSMARFVFELAPDLGAKEWIATD